MRQADLNELEVTRSIIGVIGDMDDYQLPDAKGYTSLTRYLVNESDEARQRWREEVLSTTAADFRAFADVLEQVKEHGKVVVLGSSETIKQVNGQAGRLLEPIDVL